MLSQTKLGGMESDDVHGHLQQVSGFKDANIDSRLLITSSLSNSIVAVHGLNPGLNAKNIFKHETSHAKKTWIGDNNICWLSNDAYLPSKLPGARIFIFEYNSNVAFNTLQTGINDTANHLLNALFLERQNCPHRPLAFICHSLGGLVAKRTFVKAQQPVYKDVANATRIFIFFGSPHRGGHGVDEGEWISSFVRKARGEPKSSFMEALGKESEMAQTIHEDFVNYLDVEKHHILTFFEAKGPINYVDPIVGQNSAKFGLGSRLETTIELPRDHSNICKFSTRDHLYELVEKRIVHFAHWAIKNTADFHPSSSNLASASQSTRERGDERKFFPETGYTLRTRNSSTVSSVDSSSQLTARIDHTGSNYSDDDLVPVSLKSLETTQSIATSAPYTNLPAIDKPQTLDPHSKGQHERVGAVCFAVPYERNHDYVNRQTLMDDLESFLTTRGDFQARTALYGLGGVGKTQIAIEVAFKYRQRYPEHSVYWIQAGSRDRFRQSFSNIAEKLFGSVNEDERTDHFEIVKNWLSRPENGDWLMIVDNADDMDVFQNQYFSANESVFPESDSFPFPDCVHGTILTTTRDRKIALDFAGHRCAIHVPRMSPEESSILIKSLPGSVEESKTLMRELDYLPLALSQATAFMHHNDMRIKTYLEMICDERHIESLLGENYVLHGRENNKLNAVTTTWIVSFDQIRNRSPIAAELLSLLAFFDRQGIPKSLLQKGQDRLQLEKSLGILKAFSLITENTEDNNIHIHRLIQITIKLWLRGSSLESQLAEMALDLLSASFPSGKYGTWPQCEILFPHALAISQNSLIRETPSEKLPLLLTSIGRYQDSRNDFSEAETSCHDALSVAKVVFWENDDRIIECYEPLLMVLKHQGKFEEGEDIARELLKSVSKKSSLKDESVLAAMLLLSNVLQDQGKYKEATELVLKVMKQREYAPMDVKPTIADCNQKLATLYDIQGNYYEAEKQSLRCISKIIDFCGPNDLMIHKVRFRLAFILNHQQRYLESELMMRDVIEKQKVLLGPKSRDVLVSRWGLARILRDSGSAEKLEEAEKILWKLSEISLKYNGPRHPDFLTLESDLAVIMVNLERYEEAEKLTREVLEARERVLRKGHPRIFSSKSRLATVLRCRGVYAEAETIELEVLKYKLGEKKSLFHSLPIGCFKTYFKLGLIYADWPGHDKQAHECHVKAFEGRKKALTWQHLDTQSSATETAKILRRLGKSSELKKLELDMAKNMSGGSLESTSTSSLGTWNSGSSFDDKKFDKI